MPEHELETKVALMAQRLTPLLNSFRKEMHSLPPLDKILLLSTLLGMLVRVDDIPLAKVLLGFRLAFAKTINGGMVQPREPPDA